MILTLLITSPSAYTTPNSLPFDKTTKHQSGTRICKDPKTKLRTKKKHPWAANKQSMYKCGT